MKRRDLSGQKFGRLTAVEYVFSQRGIAHWRCVCDCGGEAPYVASTSLHSGNTRSCGCLKKEAKDLEDKLAAERETRIALAKEAKEAALEAFAEYDAKISKLREALEIAAIHLEGWDDEESRRIRAVLKETE